MGGGPITSKNDIGEKRMIVEGLEEINGSKYEVGTKGEFLDENLVNDDENRGDNHWEKSVQEVSPDQSKKNFENGLNKAREILNESKGEFIGARFEAWNSGWPHSSLTLIVDDFKEESEDAVVKAMARGYKRSTAFFDDGLASVGASSGDGKHFDYYIGSKKLYSYSFNSERNVSPYYFIDNQPVTGEDYELFEKEVKKIIQEHHASKGYDHAVPQEIADKVQKEILKEEAGQVLYEIMKDGVSVSPGEVTLKKTYYILDGDIAYGKETAYGKYEAFDLNALRSGEKIKKDVKFTSEVSSNDKGCNKILMEQNTAIVITSYKDRGNHLRPFESREVYICE